ncbi:DUF4376 domain-containing protein [Salmonella enterica]
MAQYAYYHPATCEVLDWIDDAALNVVLPESIVPVNDEQWRSRNQKCWICLTPLSFITTPPPGEFYRLEGDKWVYDPEAFAAALAQAKAQMVEEIKTYRDRLTTDYIVIDDIRFHSDPLSRTQQTTLTRMGQAGTVPAGLMWKTRSSEFIEMTNELAAQFEPVTMAHDTRLFANAQRHIDAVEILEDIQMVQIYDYSDGWQP